MKPIRMIKFCSTPFFKIKLSCIFFSTLFKHRFMKIQTKSQEKKENICPCTNIKYKQICENISEIKSAGYQCVANTVYTIKVQG